MNLQQICQQVFKFKGEAVASVTNSGSPTPDNMSPDQTKSNFLTSNRSVKPVAIASQFIDLKKIEKVNSANLLVAKRFTQPVNLGPLVVYLQSIKEMFRNSKVALFFLDSQMQEMLFSDVQTKSTKFKKNNICLRNVIALYVNDDDLVWPHLHDF